MRQALQSVQDEFLPVKENIMTLLEHLKETSEKQGEKRGHFLGQAHTLIRLLSATFAEFTPAHADRVRQLPDEMLDELTDAIALHRTWSEIEPMLHRPDEE